MDAVSYTHLHKDSGHYISITKGAPEYLLERSERYYEGGELRPMTSTIRNQILKMNREFAENALRVLAICCQRHSSNPPVTVSYLERNLIFVGLVGFMDPPRVEAIHAVRECKSAGIRPVMITGDHALTAAAIGKQLGILTDENQVMTGRELGALDDQRLYESVYNYPVFARVSPSDKMRIDVYKRQILSFFTGSKHIR